MTSERTVVLRAPDVASILNISVESLYRWIRLGRFPKGIQYGPRAVGWRRDEVDAWVAEKLQRPAV